MTGEKEMFWDIWKQHDGFCEVCDEQIIGFNIVNYAHILPKSKYESLRLEPENIAVLCFNCHFKLDHETHKAKRDSRFAWLFKKAEKLKEKFSL